MKHLGHLKLSGMLRQDSFRVLEPVSTPYSELNEKGGDLFEEGVTVIKDHLKKRMDLPFENYQLIQPSGLSRENKVSVKQILSVLQYWTTHPLQAEWESTFPLGGLEGTLKDKFEAPPLMGVIHAKTGSLNNVTGLAGYYRNKDNKKFLFVFLYNGNKKSGAEKFFEDLSYLSYRHP